MGNQVSVAFESFLPSKSFATSTTWDILNVTTIWNFQFTFKLSHVVDLLLDNKTLKYHQLPGSPCQRQIDLNSYNLKQIVFREPVLAQES